MDNIHFPNFLIIFNYLNTGIKVMAALIDICFIN